MRALATDLAILCWSIALVAASCADATTAGDAAPDALEADDTPDPIDGSDATIADVDDAIADTGDRDTAIAEEPDTSIEADAADVAEAVAGEFDPSHLLAIDIVMQPDDWDALRAETRTLYDLLGPGCLASAAEDAFDYREGDVTIDGLTIRRAGVRKKGFLGSLDVVRPSLRIELDEIVPGQRLGDLERLTLNNGKQDPSRLKQCLAYQVFRDAGLAASGCAFAHVVVNDLDLGLYVHVETVKKPFLRAHFGEPLGQLWEGALSDFRDGWLGTFDPKIDDGPQDPAPLQAVVDALAEPDETLLEALDQLIDLDQFIRFWAVEVLVAHWDGYAGNTNNFFVYAPGGEDGRLRFIPWGVDGTFIREAGGLLATGALAERLARHPIARAKYVAELSRLLDDVWDEARYIDLVAAWDALTFDAREEDGGEGSSAVADLKAFISERRRVLEAALLELPEPPPLRPPPCATDGGTVSAELSTRWNTLAIEDLFTTGDGTFDVDSDVLPALFFGRVGAKAGADPAAPPGSGQIVIAAQVLGAGIVAVVLDLARPFAPGTRALGTEVQAIVYYIAPDGTGSLTGFLGDGELVLESAGELLDDGTGRGSVIEGHFSARLYGFF